MEAFKQTIVEKDSEIAELSKELKTLQTRLHAVNRCQSDEEEEEEELHRLTVESSELRAKLIKAENEKQEVERQLEATHRKMVSFQELIAELREKKDSTSQVNVCVQQAYEIVKWHHSLHLTSHCEVMVGNHY